MDETAIPVNPWMVLPFGVLLACIALGPLAAPRWWAKYYAFAACGLAVPTLGYYFVALGAAHRVWHTAHEYLSFMAIGGALFVVAGGIHIRVKGPPTPLRNAAFLFVGAVLANILGTTGASILLIRPWLRLNSGRLAAYHVVFFIFIVSNVGGCLTPIGDPPLFLGYLMGVPFWWVAEHCLAIWATGVGILLAMFVVLDARAGRRNASTATQPEAWRFEGLGNLFFLGIILVAVFIDHPAFLREGLMLAASLGSYFTTRREVHDANRFNFHPLLEVAFLFVGIFATMMPALDWLQANAGRVDNLTTTLLYWGSGTLSSTLDNAPTYLCCLKAVCARFVDPATVHDVANLVQTHGAVLGDAAGAHAEAVQQTYAALQKYHAGALAKGSVGADAIQVAGLLGNPALNSRLIAISVASVFFGACTYIGNGPNFMIKAIAEQERVPTPSFPGYLFRFTLPYMLPMLLIVWLIFLRR